MSTLTSIRSGLILLALMACLVSTAAGAAELILIEQSRCVACKKFNATVGRQYNATKQGQTAPLRRVRVDNGRLPGNLAKLGIRGTPTFILVDGGRVIGRFAGFRTPRKFWADLDSLLTRLPD